jgi:hypothetical protein
MVHEDSIAFAAPSQLRLHLVADADGNVRLAVLSPYNQPIGALRSLQATVAEVDAFFRGESESIVARSEGATCTFIMGTDMDHRNLKVTCEEPARWFKLEDVIIIDEFKELVLAATTKASGATVI